MAIATAPRSGRRKAIGTRKRWDVKDLQENHRRILRLKYQGLKHEKIAEECGVSAVTVSGIVNSELGRRQLAAMHEAADTKAILTEREIAEEAMEAHKLLKGVMRGEEGFEADIKTRVAIAEGYLGRAGFAPVSKNQTVPHTTFNPKDIDEAKERAAAAKVELAPIPENVVPLTGTGS